MKFVHVCFGISAYASLKYVLHNTNEHHNEQIICVEDDFSIGPVYKLDSSEGLRKRTQWIKELLLTTGSLKDQDYLSWIETTISSISSNLSIITKIPNDSRVILWYGHNVSDAIGLRFVVFLLQNKNIQFEEVNVTEYKVQARKTPYAYVLRSLAEMPSHWMLDALKTKQQISDSKIKKLIHDWKSWSQTKDILRILLDGNGVAVSEDYYDTIILENISSEYQKASRVVGEIIGKSEQNINETYLTLRMHQMIQEEKLSHRGNLESLGKFEVRLL